jgi:hypothetical protein
VDATFAAKGLTGDVYSWLVNGPLAVGWTRSEESLKLGPGTTPLALAWALNHRAAAVALFNAGAGLVVLKEHPYPAHESWPWLLKEVAQRIAEGSLTINHEQLWPLALFAILLGQATEPLLELLQAAERTGLRLEAEDIWTSCCLGQCCMVSFHWWSIW